MIDRLRQLWRRSLVRNTIWMLLGHASRVGLQAAYFILAARVLGAEGLGVFSGALALSKILLPFSAWSSDEILVRRVAQEDRAYAEALGNALLILAVSGTLFTCLAGGISHWLFAGRVSLTLMLTIASGELLCYRFQMLVRRAFQAYERLNVTAFFKAAPSFALLSAVVGFHFTSPERDIELWGWWYFGAMLSVAALGALVMFRELGGPRFSPRAAWRQLPEGFFFALSEACKTIYTDADKILLLRLVSREVAGVYKAGYRVLSVLMMPVLALMDAAYARFFRMGVGGVRGSYGFALRLMPLTVIYASVVAGGLWLAAPLAPLVLGPGYEETVSVVRWLAPIMVIQAASYLLMQTLTGGGHQRARSLTQLVVAIGNVAGNALLIPLYWWRASAAVAVLSELLLAVLVFGLCRWTSRAAEQPQADADLGEPRH